MSLIFIDCEAYGNCPALGNLTEFGAVEYESLRSFHGIIEETLPDPTNSAVPLLSSMSLVDRDARREVVFSDFDRWLAQFPGRPVMVSDNPAFDFMWIADGFWRSLGRNPLGHSARRIGDFYAGLTGDFRNAQKWKKLRVTKHDHDPVHDSQGNVEAFRRMLAGERA